MALGAAPLLVPQLLLSAGDGGGARQLPFRTPPRPLPRLNACRNVNTRSSSPTTVGQGDGSLSLTLLPNALRRKGDPNWRGGFSLGVDLGGARTGLALGKGFSPRALSVLELRGQKLELRLMEIAEMEEVDEFIIGLPRSSDGKETPQSNKVRSIAGRFSVRAAERGWRVYLQDENATSVEALDFMISMGVRKHDHQERIDAYSAMIILERYFSASGHGTELVLPKQLDLQENLRRGAHRDMDFFLDD